MSQEDLDYNSLKKAIIAELDKLCSEGLYKRAILATSADNHVTARRMRFIPNGLTLYCWTDARSKKVKQIRENPSVAAVAGFIQVEGKAELRGHPLREENVEYIEAYKRKLPVAYEKVERPTFENTSHIELIKVSPTKISIPSMEEVFSVRILDLEKKKAYRIYGVDWAEAQIYKNNSNR